VDRRDREEERRESGHRAGVLQSRSRDRKALEHFRARGVLLAARARADDAGAGRCDSLPDVLRLRSLRGRDGRGAQGG